MGGTSAGGCLSSATVLPRISRQLAHLVELLALPALASVRIPRRQRAYQVIPTRLLPLTDLTFGRILI